MSDPWEPYGRSGLYQLDVASSAHHAYRADGVLCGTDEALLGVLNDPESFTSWLPRTRAATLVKRDGLTQWVHVVSNAPWPLRDRHMVYELTPTLLDDGVQVTIAGKPELLPDMPGAVPLKAAQGTWISKSAGERKEVSFMLHVDVGKTPALFARRSLSQAVQQAITNLETRFGCEQAP